MSLKHFVVLLVCLSVVALSKEVHDLNDDHETPVVSKVVHELGEDAKAIAKAKAKAKAWPNSAYNVARPDTWGTDTGSRNLNMPGPAYGQPGYKESHEWETAVDWFSPVVFKWEFYRSQHAELKDKTKSVVRAAWLAYVKDPANVYPGCKDGSGLFSIDRYYRANQALKDTTDNGNCHKLYENYLTQGIYNGKMTVNQPIEQTYMSTLNAENLKKYEDYHHTSYKWPVKCLKNADFTKSSGLNWMNSGVKANCKGVNGDAMYGFKNGDGVGTLGHTVTMKGTAKIDFGNCWNQGMVSVYQKSPGKAEVKLSTAEVGKKSNILEVAVNKGDVINIRDEGKNSVIQLSTFCITGSH